MLVIESSAHWLHSAYQWLRAGWPTAYVPTWITLIGFVWGLGTFWNAKKRERFKLGVDLILKLEERFDTDRMRGHRAAAARYLLGDGTNRNADVDVVIDFFEEVGFLLRRDAIDAAAVHAFFSYWLEAYCRASAQYRADVEDPVWVDFTALCMAIELIELRQMSCWFQTRLLVWRAWVRRPQVRRWARMNDASRKVLNEECALATEQAM